MHDGPRYASQEQPFEAIEPPSPDDDQVGMCLLGGRQNAASSVGRPHDPSGRRLPLRREVFGGLLEDRVGQGVSRGGD